MEEYYLSGYCRCLDASRIVEVITEDGCVTEVDCNFENCPHTPGCTIAQSITQLQNQAL